MNLFQYKMTKAALDNATKYQDIYQIIKNNYKSYNKYRFLLTTQAYAKYKTLFRKPLAESFLYGIRTNATKWITHSDSYEELVELFQNLPFIELRTVYKRDIQNLVELVGIKPFPTELTIAGYGSNYTTELCLNNLNDSTRILLDLEQINKPDYTIVKQLKATYDKTYDITYYAKLLEEVTQLKTNLESIHKRNNS